MNDLRFDTSGLDSPKTWEDLAALHDFLPTYPGATRQRKDQEAYDTFTASKSREDLLEQLKKQIGDSEVVLLENEFPYSRILEHLPHVKHYLLWSRKGEVSSELMDKLIAEKFPGKKWFYFVTADENKSIPEIWHAHVMINSGE